MVVAAVPEPKDPTLFFFWKLSMTELTSVQSSSCRKFDICKTRKHTQSINNVLTVANTVGKKPRVLTRKRYRSARVDDFGTAVCDNPESRLTLFYNTVNGQTRSMCIRSMVLLLRKRSRLTAEFFSQFGRNTRFHVV